MCGVIGIYAPGKDISRLLFFTLYALQHRGQESAGMVLSNSEGVFSYIGRGLTSQIFSEEVFRKAFPLEITCGIAHNRYSTTGVNSCFNAQPLIGESAKRLSLRGERIRIALAHNGNIVNAFELKKKLEKENVKFRTTSDSEILLNIILQGYGKNLQGDIINMMRQAQGAYSIVLLAQNKLWAVRDQYGIRPLVLGQLEEDSWIVASETCAIDTLGATFIKEVAPGSIVMIDETGYHEMQAIPPSSHSNLCIFEFIYFARPDSYLLGKRVELVRRELGKQLALEFPVINTNTIVINVPDSSTPHAKGYAKQLKIKFEEVFIKNRYIHRTFIQPDQTIRELGVQLKLNILPELVKNKKIVIVEDSIVRGTTTSQIVRLLKKYGAKKVHVRVASPPYRYPCFYGIDTAAINQLIAYKFSIQEICQQIEADSLEYLSIDGLIKAIGLPKENFCLACFDGNYPIPIPDQLKVQKYIFEK